MNALRRYTADAAERQGWRLGTELENRVAYLLGRFGVGPERLEQQHRAGRYRLDFADTAAQIAIEADGWWHRSPDGAARDAIRDAWLRSDGWIVLRVDDHHGEESLVGQVVRVAQLVNTLASR